MAKVRVIEGQEFPALCAKTGQPTTDRVRLRGRAEPEWLGGLILFGFVAYLFASFLSSRRYALEVPLSREVVQRYRQYRHLTIGLVIGGVVLAISSALAHFEAVIWFFAVIAIGLFVGAYNMGANNVRVMTDRSGSLVLSGVHPDFARTVEAQPTSGVN